MKKIGITYKIAFLVALVAFAGCMRVLDKTDLNAINDDIWEDEGMATAYINNLYANNMPSMALGDYSGISDEIFSSETSYKNFLYGINGETDINTFELMTREYYGLIRRINFGIKGLENSVGLADTIKNQLIGQCMFLRAYKHWTLVQAYGGIVMLMHVQNPFYETLDLPRSSASECVKLIVDDLDKAIEYLPVEWDSDNNGRITSGAAAAMKGRILLHYASPLFNPDNEQERWVEAYDSNAKAIELLSKMNTPRELYSDFGGIFTIDVLDNPEAVIFKRYDANSGEAYTSSWEASIRPVSAGGNMSYTPTWNLVKAFPMVNGKLINDSSSGYDSTFYWQNRDPRFYETIGYNGCSWKFNGSDFDRQWAYQRNTVESNRSPASGFYNKKASDESINESNTGLTSTSWIELRYAEVLLNYAECANEIGKTSEAIGYVRQIRVRAGIDEGVAGNTYGISDNVSKTELRQLIMIERQVEFAFENKRYWDLRRRLMFREDLGDIVKKLNGTYRLGLTTSVNGAYLRRITDSFSDYKGWNRIDTIAYLGHINIDDNDNYNTYFKTALKVMDTDPINYLEMYDFFAMPKRIIESSDSIEQTLGWQFGTFDPLEE